MLSPYPVGSLCEGCMGNPGDAAFFRVACQFGECILVSEYRGALQPPYAGLPSALRMWYVRSVWNPGGISLQTCLSVLRLSVLALSIDPSDGDLPFMLILLLLTLVFPPSPSVKPCLPTL